MASPITVEVEYQGQPVGRYVLTPERALNKIGRAPSSAIQLQDPAAATFHAAIELSAAGSHVVDMGSANGTSLNGNKVSRAPLKAGDRIQIGATTLTIVEGAAATVTPAAPAEQPGWQPASAALSQAAPPPGVVAESAAPSPLQRALPKAAQVGFLPGQEAPADPDDTLDDDDPMVARMKRANQRNRRLALLGLPIAAAIIAIFVYAASVQEAPQLATPASYTSARPQLSPEQVERLALFDTTEPRDEAKYVYYRVSHRQSLREIANKFYEDPSLVNLLVASNPKVGSASEALEPQQEVRIMRYLEYKVQDGDTWENIAQAKLSNADRASALQEANPQAAKEAGTLAVGATIKIPLFAPKAY